jgi:peptide deformylase
VKQQILQSPDDRLRVVAEPFPERVEDYHPSHLSAIADLLDTFAATTNCIGLAATQIGCPWRVIVVDVTERRGELYVMVNPVIVKASEDLQLVNDGCMSVYNGRRRYNTKRPKRITVEWTDRRHNQQRKQKFSGLLAAVIHHEIDHLNGVLFTDHVDEKILARDTEVRGRYMGKCNRRACITGQPATWWNRVESAHYCEPCATEINKWVPDHVPKLVQIEDKK